MPTTKPIGIFFQGTSTHAGHEKDGELISTLATEWDAQSRGSHLIMEGPGNNIQESSSYLSSMTSYVTSWAGAIAGDYGPGNWHYNTDTALQFIKDAITKDGPPPYISICGHSRGGISCYMLAHKLASDALTKDIPIKILAVDPVAGDLPLPEKLYGYTFDDKQSSIPSSVTDCTVMIATACRLPWFTSIVPAHDKDTTMTVKTVELDHPGIDGLQSTPTNPLAFERLTYDRSKYELTKDYCRKMLDLSYVEKEYTATSEPVPSHIQLSKTLLESIKDKHIVDFRSAKDPVAKIIRDSQITQYLKTQDSLKSSALNAEDLIKPVHKYSTQVAAKPPQKSTRDLVINALTNYLDYQNNNKKLFGYHGSAGRTDTTILLNKLNTYPDYSDLQIKQEVVDYLNGNGNYHSTSGHHKHSRAAYISESGIFDDLLTNRSIETPFFNRSKSDRKMITDDIKDLNLSNQGPSR